MTVPIDDVVSRYFELDAARDHGSLVALFAENATVVDERQTWRGTDEIRAWRTGPASTYEYATEIEDTTALAPNRRLVRGRLTGNFPGGVADLCWDFTTNDGLITRLVIAP